jgi:host factor-I protein
MSQFDTNLPSIRLIQRYIKDKQDLEVKIETGDVLNGKILWQDPAFMCIGESMDAKPHLVAVESVVYVKPI